MLTAPSLATSRNAVPMGGGQLDIAVRSFMTPGAIGISDDASLGQAFDAMNHHNVHALLVVGHREGVPLGWVTARGLMAHVDSDPHAKPLRDAVTHPIVTIDPSATLREAITELSAPAISHLLVIHSWSRWPLGVVTHSNVVAALGDR